VRLCYILDPAILNIFERELWHFTTLSKLWHNRRDVHSMHKLCGIPPLLFLHGDSSCLCDYEEVMERIHCTSIRFKFPSFFLIYLVPFAIYPVPFTMYPILICFVFLSISVKGVSYSSIFFQLINIINIFL